MTDIDTMSDDELESYLASRATKKSASPGVVEYAWLLIVAGIVGTVASLQLLFGELELKADPYANLACDVNELLSCSTFLTSWEGSLLGFSNSYLGIVSFGVMILFGSYVLFARTVATFMWAGVAVGSGVGLLALLWFQYVSFIESQTLCPWCIVIWAAIIPFIVHSSGQVIANLRHRPTWLWRFRWAAIAVWYLAIVVFAFVFFFDTWMYIFGWN